MRLGRVEPGNETGRVEPGNEARRAEPGNETRGVEPGNETLSYTSLSLFSSGDFRIGGEVSLVG